MGGIIMFKYKPLDQQVVELRKKNAQLNAENEKLKSDLDYVAMMADIDLDEGSDDEKEVVDNG